MQNESQNATAADSGDPRAGGRREENRRRTRESLLEAAAQLFRERGYDATAVRDIAAAAGVGERTFFRYFPSKESLVLEQARALIPLLCDGIRRRPPEEAGLLALRNAILAMVPYQGGAILLSGPQQIAAPGKFGRGEGHLLRDMEQAVADAFLDRLAAAGADPDAPGTRLRASVLAKAGVGVLRAIRTTWVQLPEAARARLDVPDYVRDAFAATADA